MQKRLRCADLIALGIVNNRPCLRNWILKHGFPPGQLTGPNTRTWTESEVTQWLDSRPVAPKDTPAGRGGGRKAKAAQPAGAFTDFPETS